MINKVKLMKLKNHEIEDFVKYCIILKRLKELCYNKKLSKEEKYLFTYIEDEKIKLKGLIKKDKIIEKTAII